jgi:hypothetical protein
MSNFSAISGWERTSYIQWDDTTLIFVAAPQHCEERANTGWFGIRIMGPSGTTCLSLNCCFSTLALLKSH